MPILAIDTATLASSIAVLGDTGVVAELSVHTGKTHSERLVPQIKALLEYAEVKRQDLQGIAVSVGPGSFTGLRIGIATAKAMAFALDIPIVGVNTLAALAANIQLPGMVLSPLLDAQKGNVYQGLYEWQGTELRELEPVCILPLTEAINRAAGRGKPAVILGEMNQAAAPLLPGSVVLAPEHLTLPRAASLGQLARQRFAAGEVDDAFRLQPYYLRRSAAEEMWEQKHGAGKG